MIKLKISPLIYLPVIIALLSAAAIVTNAQDVKPSYEITAEDKPAPRAVIDKALADQAKGDFKQVDYAKTDFDPKAKAMEALYPVDPNTWIQAECGGKYLDKECYVRKGVPVPPNVVFTAVDEKGNPTYKGVRLPTAEEMKNLPISNYPENENPVRPPAKIPAYYGEYNHNEQGWLLPWAYPHAGLYANQSSPNWNMPGQGTWWDYYIWQVMYPGDGCLESGMQHNRQNGVVYHYHAYNNHCSGSTPYYPQAWVGYEDHNAAWSSAYERMNMGGMSYLEYLWVYIKTGSTTPATKSCTQAVMYNWNLATWEQKQNVCGWQNQYSIGDAWNLVEAINIWNWQSGRWQCEFNPTYPLMSNSVQYFGTNNQWNPAVNNASVYDTMHDKCDTWHLGTTWDPYGRGGWIKY